jgi:phenylalanyl-tRNA synthetase alpha chain
MVIYRYDYMSSGEWKDASFKKYNFDAVGIPPSGGHLHPLMKVRQEFREIFFEMGFEEMPTNRFVESSFWNFDALFQPQQHPARDAHDTFFIKGKNLQNDSSLFALRLIPRSSFDRSCYNR